MKVCSQPGCGELVKAGKCDTHRREYDKRRGTTTERGYGAEHRATRDALLPSAYGTACRYCGNRMWPHEHLALDHTEDRSSYRGIVHADYRDCPKGGNAAEGATRGNLNRSSHT
ncbi:MAG: hypothetical protein JWQ77_2337 [Jatrophihabitans sp.]|nr:hypothetical protein [Jatrophihabitans sp.]